MSELRVGIVTVSDSVHAGEHEDAAAPLLVRACEERGWDVVGYYVCPHDAECISTSLIDLADVARADVVLTCGGIGVGARHVTPEATLAVGLREVPGIAEAMRAEARKKTADAMLTRAAATMRDATLIVNLPGPGGLLTPMLDVFLGQLETAAAGMAEDRDG